MHINIYFSDYRQQDASATWWATKQQTLLFGDGVFAVEREDVQLLKLDTVDIS
jgi:hypothetical protein